MNAHLPPSRIPSLRFVGAALAAALLAFPFTAHSQNYTASSNNSTSPITISSGNHTISVGSSGSLTRSNAITLSGGTLQGGIMDNVATVSNLSGAGTSSTFVDANGVTIILRGSGTTDTTADLTLAGGISITGANQLLVGGGAGGGGGRGNRNHGGGGGGGFVVLTTGNLSGTVALTAGGGSAGAAAAGAASASGSNSSIGATTASGGGGAAAANPSYPTGKGGDSGQDISGSSSTFTGGNGSRIGNVTGNGGGGGGAGSSANGANAPNHTTGGDGGAGTQITTGVIGLSTYIGSDTFGGGGGGGARGTAGGSGGTGGGGAGGSTDVGTAGTDGLGGGGGGGSNGSGPSGGDGGAGSVAVQYAYDSNVAAGNLTLTGGITLSSASTLDAVRSGGLIDITTTGISGSGDLNISSSASSGGVVRFSVANTYSGTTTINSGATLQLGNVNALQNTTLDTGTSGSQQVSFTVAGANTYNIGAIQGGDTLDFGANTISVGSNNATTSFTGILAGSGGSLTKEGTGTLTLSATNTYSGSTTVNAGTLAVSGNMANSGLVLNSSGIISPGTTAAVDTFGTTSITINGGGYNWTLSTANGSAGTGYDQITSTGTLTSSGALTVYVYGNATGWDGSASYDWDIFDANTVTGFSAGNFSVDLTNFGIAGGDRLGDWTFSQQAGGIIRLSYAPSSDPAWTGGSNTFSSGFSPAASNGDSVFFAGAGGGTATNDSITSLGNMTFMSGAGAYTVAGNAFAVTGAITNNEGSNIQTLNTNVTPGSIVINAGTLQVGAAGRLSSGTYSGTLANEGTFLYSGTNAQTLSGVISGTGALTKNAASTLTLSGNNTYSGATTINAGTLEIGAAGRLGAGTYAGNIANDGVLIYSGTSAQTLSGVISGTGALTKNGSGTLTLTGANTHTGATTINAGTLQVGSGSTTGSLSASTSITNDATLVFNRSNDFTVSNTISGSGDLIQNGSGTLTLSGASSSYTGTTTLNAGTIQIGHANGLGSGGDVTFSGGELKYGTGVTADLSSRIKNSGSAILVDTNGESVTWGTNLASTNTGGLTKNGTGTLTINVQSAYSGATAINAGTLQVGSGSTTGSLSASTSITNDATLVFNRSNDFTVSNTISGSGDLIQNGRGTLTLSGASSSYTGTTTLNAGTIQIGHANGLGSGGDVTFSGGALKYGTGITTDLSSRIKNSGSAILVDTNGESVTWGTNLASTNTGGLTKNGTGTLRINVQSAYSGATAINGGTLQIYNASGSVQWSPGVIAINNASTLEFTGGGQSIFQNADDTITFDSGGGGSMIMTKNLIWRNSYIVTTGGAMNTVSGTWFNNQNNTSYDIYYDTAVGTDAVALQVSSDHQLGIRKYGLGTLVLTNSLNNMGDSTVINAGTLEIGGGGRLQSGSYAYSITNSGTFSYNSTADQTLSGVISGTGALTKSNSSTLTLSGSNTYSGGTTLNSGTLVIGNAAAAGSGTITQTDGTSLLTFDTTGTIANAMSIYNVASNKTVTLTGSITAQNTTYDVASGTTLSINGSIGGSGGVTKDGDGTLELNAANTFTGDTVVNFGTLEANATGSLASTGNITVTGGSLLVGANNAINDSAAMNLAGGNLTFSGNINETVGSLTLSANSVIDMGGGNVALEFSNLVTQLTNTTRLNIYNYTLYSDHLYFTSNANVSDSLQYISFYSDFGSSFIGNSFISSFSSPWQVQPVPEPETWATAALLLIGGGIYLLRRKITA